MRALRTDVRQRIQEQIIYRFADQFVAAAQHAFGGQVQQPDVAIDIGGNQAPTDGLNDVFMKCLQAFQRAAGIFQLDIHLAQFRGQQARQVRDRQVRKQVDEDDGFE